MSKRFLLVGWEAADWNLLNPLLDAAEMPTVGGLVDSGVMGDLASTQPLDTAAQWTTIATGKRPWRHGIVHSLECSAETGAFSPISCAKRQARTVWEILAAQGLRCLSVNWPATHSCKVPGVKVISDRYPEPTAAPGIAPWPAAADGTYWPLELGPTLDPLRVSPEHIGADVVSRFILNWQAVDQQRDRRLGQLRVLLSADFSNFAATAHLISPREWDFAAIRFSALGPIVRMFKQFADPRRPWINEAEFNSYHAVVKAQCRMLDHMLGRLIELAGPETTVLLVSEHGTAEIPQAGSPRNDPESWRSPLGLLAMRGKGISRDALLHGATVLDIAPTVLTWFGLPIAEDMEGRVLVEAFQETPLITRVKSWENEFRERVPVPASAQETPAAKSLRQEMAWNFAQSCLDGGRLEDALPELNRLFRESPERPDFAHALFQCQLNLNKLSAASETLEVLLETLPPGVASLLPKAEYSIAAKDIRQTRKLVAEILQLKPAHPAVLHRVGLLLLQLRDWTTLASLSREALKRYENDPIIWLALATASLRLGHPEEAESAARRAIQLKFFLPDAHFVLARALVALNKWDQARECMSTLVKMQPDNKSVASYNRRVQAQA